MKHARIILLSFAWLVSIGCAAQNAALPDSFAMAFRLAAHDTTKAWILNDAAEHMKDKDPLAAIEFLNQALAQAERLMQSKDNIVVKRMRELMAESNNNLGYIYKINGQLSLAGAYYYKALEVAEAANDLALINFVHSNLGALHRKNSDIDKALDHFVKALAAAEQKGDLGRIGYALSSIGSIYNIKKDTAKALSYYRKAREAQEKANSAEGLNTCNNNFGYLFLVNNEPSRALHYFFLSLQNLSAANDRREFVLGYCNISRAYTLLGKTDSALAWLKKAERLCSGIADNELDFAVWKNLYHVYKEKKNFREAYRYFELYAVLHDSMFNISNTEGVLRAQLKYDFGKKQALLVAEQEKEALLEKEAQKKRDTVAWAAAGFLALLGFFSIPLVNGYRQNKKLNAQLSQKNHFINAQKLLAEEKQKEILDSIHYAEQIQKALLANHDFVNQTLPDSFVFFRPKDIVSGDFYWAAENNGKFYLAVCDSTGHGVPGAFMSLLNISFLNEAINERGICDPSEVFNFVRKRIVEGISQGGRKDGMDGTLLCFDRQTNVISYCSANSAPVCLSKEGLIVLPADKMPVGKGEKDQPFTTHVIPAGEGDMIYLYSDGYPDQFGGEKGKKFKHRQLHELLSSIHQLDVKDQQKEIANHFFAWKGDLEQVDDVCVLGIRVHK